MKPILKHIKIIVLTVILGWSSYNAYAQKETEVFIPIGKSPGVSGKFSIIGRCENVNLYDSIVTIRDTSGVKTVRITRSTAIYFDGSRIKQTSKKGSCRNIKPGMLVEAKYKDNKPGDLIEWLKVQLE